LQNYVKEDYDLFKKKKTPVQDLSSTSSMKTAHSRQDWEYARLIRVYEARSLFCLHHSYKLRRFIVAIAENKVFDTFILSMIVVNSLSMAL
jgi:hypothetical protein